ncbi:predicted protein [Botrytis cinerea T4]|uniref:Uncharacterized protein n=1 Tax=Botryotinia fuckeliana (strain T4) TaxID=999810 RepID=G2XT78_BOTF4|nr:predicted protein [Botrytis cinerea T4]
MAETASNRTLIFLLISFRDYHQEHNSFDLPSQMPMINYELACKERSTALPSGCFASAICHPFFNS